ncbi:MAG: ATP-dependent helicase, partial [Nanoarchaeota archaeon]
AFKLLKSEKLRLLLELAIENSEVLKRRFRHCATRSLMILREYKGHKKRVGRQQVSSMLLMSALKRISNNFSILKEARREVLEDLMDIENTINVLKKIESGEIKIKEVHTNLPSPFAFNIVLQGYLDLLKMEDKIKFLRNMHTLILAKIGKQHEIEYATYR